MQNRAAEEAESMRPRKQSVCVAGIQIEMAEMQNRAAEEAESMRLRKQSVCG